MTTTHGTPPLLPVSVTGALLGLSSATAYRTVRKTFQRAPIPGVFRVLTADVERLIGRAITADEYLRAVAKAHGNTNPEINDAPEMDTVSSKTGSFHDGQTAL